MYCNLLTIKSVPSIKVFILHHTLWIKYNSFFLKMKYLEVFVCTMSSWFVKLSAPGRVMVRAPKMLIGVRTRLSKFPDVSLGKMEASNDVTDWESAFWEEMTWPPKNNKESVSHVSFLFTQRHRHDKDYRQRKLFFCWLKKVAIIIHITENLKRRIKGILCTYRHVVRQTEEQLPRCWPHPWWLECLVWWCL